MVIDRRLVDFLLGDEVPAFGAAFNAWAAWRLEPKSVEKCKEMLKAVDEFFKAVLRNQQGTEST